MSWSLWLAKGSEKDALWYRTRPFPKTLAEDLLAQLGKDYENSAAPPTFQVGSPYSRTKEFLSRSALVHLGEIASITVTWALNHIAGRTLARKDGVEPVGAPGWTHRGDRQFIEAFNRTNDEALERAGATYAFDDPDVNRTILIEFLNYFGSGHPLFAQAVEALQASAFGDPHPLLSRSPNVRATKGKGVGLALWKLRLEAVGIVQYRRGLGEGATDARDKIAALLGVTHDALADWEKETRDRFGPLLVAQKCSFEFTYGKQVRIWTDSGAPPHNEHGQEQRAHFIRRMRSDEEVEKIGVELRRLQSVGAPRKPRKTSKQRSHSPT